MQKYFGTSASTSRVTHWRSATIPSLAEAASMSADPSGLFLTFIPLIFTALPINSRRLYELRTKMIAFEFRLYASALFSCDFFSAAASVLLWSPLILCRGHGVFAYPKGSRDINKLLSGHISLTKQTHSFLTTFQNLRCHLCPQLYTVILFT